MFEYEGFFDEDNKEAAILFILKEPNTDNQGEFWLREVVKGNKKNANGKEKATATRYFNVLGGMAGHIMEGKKVDDEEEKRELLLKCGAINLISDKGGSVVGKDFKKIIFSPEKLKENRDKILEINNLNIVTFGGVVFDAVRKMGFEEVENEDGDTFKYDKAGKVFRKTTIIVNDKKVPVYEMYHPAYIFSFDKITYE